MLCSSQDDFVLMGGHEFYRAHLIAYYALRNNSVIIIAWSTFSQLLYMLGPLRDVTD